MKTTKEQREQIRHYHSPHPDGSHPEIERDVLAVLDDLDEALAAKERAEKNYYDLADAVCRESSSPEDACNQARALRARCREWEAKAARYRVELEDAISIVETLNGNIQGMTSAEIKDPVSYAVANQFIKRARSCLAPPDASRAEPLCTPTTSFAELVANVGELKSGVLAQRDTPPAASGDDAEQAAREILSFAGNPQPSPPMTMLLAAVVQKLRTRDEATIDRCAQLFVPNIDTLDGYQIIERIRSLKRTTRGTGGVR